MSEPNDEHTLVTFALFTYNQERFVREAVAGALSQTYSPLQVILSDDASSDRTFEIMQEMAAGYTGPHEVLLNRNERNLGIGAHVNRVAGLAKGELIVSAAGDDISFSQRVQEQTACWLKADKRLVSIHSSVVQIDRDGNELAVLKKSLAGSHAMEDYALRNIIIGASHAWPRKLFDVFGGLDDCIVHEDRVIGFRAALMHGVIFIDRPLLQYRIGGISDSRGKSRFRFLYRFSYEKSSRYHCDCAQNLKDIELMKATRKKSYHSLERVLRARLNYYAMMKSFASLLRRCAIVRSAR